MLLAEDARSLDAGDPIDQVIINYARGMTVGMSLQQIHQLYTSLSSDLYEPLTKEGHNVMADLVGALYYLYRENLNQEVGESDV